MPDRRELVKAMGMTAIAGLCGVYPTIATGQSAQISGSTTAPYTVPPLPYDYDALEPDIDAQTMHLHHDKHHAAYVKNLNAAVADHSELSKLPVDELVKHLDRVPESIRTTVRNNGGGHANHSLFWQLMQKNSPVNRKQNWQKPSTPDLVASLHFKSSLQRRLSVYSEAVGHG